VLTVEACCILAASPKTQPVRPYNHCLLSRPDHPRSLTDLTDSEVQTLQAGQTFVANAAAEEHIFRLWITGRFVRQALRWLTFPPDEALCSQASFPPLRKIQPTLPDLASASYAVGSPLGCVRHTSARPRVVARLRMLTSRR
jgi:hypothetical protein